MTSNINNPLSRIAFCSQWPLKGWSQLLTRNNGEGAKGSKGAHLSLLHQRMADEEVMAIVQAQNTKKTKTCTVDS